MEAIKMHLNSALSSDGACYCALPDSEYARFKYDLFSLQIIGYCSLGATAADGYAFAKTKKAWYAICLAADIIITLILIIEQMLLCMPVALALCARE